MEVITEETVPVRDREISAVKQIHPAPGHFLLDSKEPPAAGQQGCGRTADLEIWRKRRRSRKQIGGLQHLVREQPVLVQGNWNGRANKVLGYSARRHLSILSAEWHPEQ